MQSQILKKRFHLFADFSALPKDLFALAPLPYTFKEMREKCKVHHPWPWPLTEKLPYVAFVVSS
jgi:hypothetical protein